MKISHIFTSSTMTGVAAASIGTTVALTSGLPAAGVAIAASAAALGAGATSGLLWKGIGAAYDGKGAEAAITGLFLLAAGHVTAVPAAGTALAYGALKLAGFVP